MELNSASFSSSNEPMNPEKEEEKALFLLLHQQLSSFIHLDRRLSGSNQCCQMAIFIARFGQNWRNLTPFGSFGFGPASTIWEILTPNLWQIPGDFQNFDDLSQIWQI